jgi:hypothetical protein
LESVTLFSFIRGLAETSSTLIAGFDDQIVAACLTAKRSTDVLSDILAVASRIKMSPERARFFTQAPGFVQFLCRFAQNQSISEHALLDAVILLTSLVLFQEETMKLNFDLVALTARIFLANRTDIDIQGQALFVFARLTSRPEMRDQIFRNQALLGGIVDASSSTDAGVRAAANLILDAGSSFSPEIRDYLKGPRFDRFNSDWIQAIADK